MFLREKEQRNMWKKSKENLQKLRFPAYFPFSAGKKNVSKIGLGHVFGIANMYLYAKIREN